MKKGLTGITNEDLSRLVIAYEPVWAIGTGLVATPAQAQNAHEVVRSTLAELFGPSAANQVRIQYGGSVTPTSIEELMAMPDVDGALVGGASLTADSFTRIVDGGSSTFTSSNNSVTVSNQNMNPIIKNPVIATETSVAPIPPSKGIIPGAHYLGN